MKKENLIFVISIGLGCLCWIIDALLDHLFFYEGSFWGLLITNIPVHEIYIRLAVLFCFGVFGWITSILIRKYENAKTALERRQRALGTLSDCNQILVRAADENELLNQVCRIITRTSGYRLAWVGYAENDTHKSVRPVAAAGYDEGYIQSADISWGG